MMDHPIITLVAVAFVLGWVWYRVLRAGKKEPPSPPEKEKDPWQ